MFVEISIRVMAKPLGTLPEALDFLFLAGPPWLGEGGRDRGRPGTPAALVEGVVLLDSGAYETVWPLLLCTAVGENAMGEPDCVCIPRLWSISMDCCSAELETGSDIAGCVVELVL